MFYWTQEILKKTTKHRFYTQNNYKKEVAFKIKAISDLHNNIPDNSKVRNCLFFQNKMLTDDCCMDMCICGMFLVNNTDIAWKNGGYSVIYFT